MRTDEREQHVNVARSDPCLHVSLSLSSPGVTIPLATVPTIDDFYKQLTCATCILYFTIVGNVSGLNFSSAAVVCIVSHHDSS